MLQADPGRDVSAPPGLADGSLLVLRAWGIGGEWGTRQSSRSGGEAPEDGTPREVRVQSLLTLDYPLPGRVPPTKCWLNE